MPINTSEKRRTSEPEPRTRSETVFRAINTPVISSLSPAIVEDHPERDFVKHRGIKDKLWGIMVDNQVVMNTFVAGKFSDFKYLQNASTSADSADRWTGGRGQSYRGQSTGATQDYTVSVRSCPHS
jgi:hypothetical protein